MIAGMDALGSLFSAEKTVGSKASVGDWSVFRTIDGLADVIEIGMLLTGAS